ncbi:killer cell lectin-like receptor subfamily B member 1B allele C [Mauremys reevesii]|uniref:killer cell lectin-like receptor subfamily B member 1B allele C n=1 Tax=Mauremys reevesii TaxID=260615 RepID=UPI00193FE16E|nr:killer cell lectin-like receptor subfamily B member 1B allele C [Mauremys reevesii]
MRLLLDSVLFCPCSPSSALVMAGEIVYADLNILGASSNPLHPPRHLNHTQCPRWHRLAAGLGAAGILILLGAVIAMGVWEGSGCKLCPPNWLLRRDKCYWVSKEKNPWDKSRDDCSRRSSRLLVIRDQDEMTFIQNTSKDTNQLWLGLTVTSPARNWTWVDGSVFNPTLFNVKDPAEEKNSCGMIKADRIHFETCSAASKWICEKDALLI